MFKLGDLNPGGNDSSCDGHIKVIMNMFCLYVSTETSRVSKSVCISYNNWSPGLFTENNNNTSIIIISFFFSAYVPIVHTQKLVYGLLMFPVLMLYSYIIVLYQAVSQADSSQD